VTYAISVEELPDEFRSLTVTVEVVVVADPDGLGPCYRDTYHGPHDPTPTPMAPPDDEDCYRPGTAGDALRLDLTTIDDSRSIGPFAAPGSFDGGHALLVVDVAGTLENGTRTTSFRDTAFPALQVANGGPADRNRPYDVIAGGFGRQYNVTITVGPAHPDFRDEFKYEVTVEHE
jgi:hypothetical protein